LRQRLATLESPRSAGKALTGSKLGTYWRYRLTDYRLAGHRLICHVQDEVLVILVIELGNRQDIRR
jgi:mRNA interferase RelE/StbE